MKKILTIICVLLYVNTYSQTVDEIITSYMIGEWQHVQSTFPNDSVVRYERTFDFRNDGTLYCLMDTSYVILGTWMIKDTLSYLYTVVDGKEILSNVCFVEFIGTDNFMKELINFVKSHIVLNLTLDNIDLAKDLCDNPSVSKEHKYECVVILNSSKTLFKKDVYLLN